MLHCAYYCCVISKISKCIGTVNLEIISKLNWSNLSMETGTVGQIRIFWCAKVKQQMRRPGLLKHIQSEMRPGVHSDSIRVHPVFRTCQCVVSFWSVYSRDNLIRFQMAKIIWLLKNKYLVSLLSINKHSWKSSPWTAWTSRTAKTMHSRLDLLFWGYVLLGCFLMTRLLYGIFVNRQGPFVMPNENAKIVKTNLFLFGESWSVLILADECLVHHRTDRHVPIA